MIGICTALVQDKILVVPFVQSFHVQPSKDLYVLLIGLCGGEEKRFYYAEKEDAYNDLADLQGIIEIYYKEVLTYVQP